VPVTIEGGCRCGATRYALAIDVLPPAYACHCHQCQRWSGSAFAVQVIVPEAALSVTGPVVVYEKTTEDRTSTQRICGVCHARIYNSNTRRPDVAVIRAGTLDRSEELDCIAHIFTRSKQAWMTIPEGVANWLEGPEPAPFLALMMGTGA